MKLIPYLLSTLLLACASPALTAQEQAALKIPNYRADLQKENLGRGLVAIHNGKGQVSVSWRYLESDPLDVAFDLYRKTGKGKPVKLNASPLTTSTFFTDKNAKTSNDNTYILKLAGSSKTEKGGEYLLSVKRAAIPYLSIPITQVPGDDNWRYQPNDASVGDLDGDGEYELVIKRENGGKDNSHRGLCNGGTLLDAYKLDGTFMWRVDLGVNIRQGAHYTQFLVYDFDGDGKAEIAVKTAEGTTFGDGTTIGDTDGDGMTDYVDRNPRSGTFGMILKGPEFLSVIDGATGKELARDNFIPRGAPREFGDSHGNRVDRFLGGAGYFDGKHPSILICRGYYAKAVLEAWDYRDGKLTKRWKFSTTDDNGKYKDYEGQGNHNLRIGDVDGDGKDEITYGACMIDHDGTGGYSTRLGHGDAIHLTDIDIDRPGLEVWDCHEASPNRAGSELRDARTGELIWGIPAVEDVGRAMAADIDPRFRGCEVWTISSRGVYTAKGQLITERTPSINMAIWWDGDLNRELLDGSGVPGRERVNITKWNGDGVSEIPLPDAQSIAANNYTKSNPCIQADLLGDWREEITVRTKDNREVRIYMTDYPTDYRFHTLMSDVIYRMSVLTENIAYNQPTQPGFYLGSDLGKFWPSYYQYRSRNGKDGRTKEGRPNGMHARMEGGNEVVVRDITATGPTYTFDARHDYDSYEWTVDGKPIKGERYMTIEATTMGYGRPVKITLKAAYKGCIFEDNCTVTFVKPEARK